MVKNSLMVVFLKITAVWYSVVSSVRKRTFTACGGRIKGVVFSLRTMMFALLTIWSCLKVRWWAHWFRFLYVEA